MGIGEMIGLAALIINILGLAVGYGMFRQQLATLIEDMKWVKGKLSNGISEMLIRHDERIDNLEERCGVTAND